VLSSIVHRIFTPLLQYPYGMGNLKPDAVQASAPEHARTERRSDGSLWYVLDNAAAFMPALTDRTATLVFRVSATLTERIKLPALQEALTNLAPRFPYYRVELRHGFFWYYLEPLLDRVPEPSADSKFPCLNMRVRRRGRFLFRVRAYRSRIAVEFCHVLTDGYGALVYLKAIIAEYLHLLGLDLSGVQGVFRPDELPAPEESEDAFKRYFKQDIPFPGVARKAFHLHSLPLFPGQYRVTTGIMPLGPLLSLAKARGATLTEFLVAVYLAALQDIYHALPGPIRRTLHPLLSVEVPVNLRRLFPSTTMRNFSLYVLPTLDTRLGFYEFPEIVKRVHHYMQGEIDVKNISMQIARNVGGGRSLLVRMLPLALKGVAARAVYKRLGEDTFSGLFSNLGPVELPEPLAGRVERFDFIPAPSRQCKTTANAVSWKDRLFISFGSLALSTELERLFFSRIAGMGVTVSVESNL